MQFTQANTVKQNIQSMELFCKIGKKKKTKHLYSSWLSTDEVIIAK